MSYDTPAWRAVQAADGGDQVAFTLALVRRLLAEAPEHWPARLLLGKLLTRMARHQDAREVLDALADDPVSSGGRTRWLLYGAVADLDDRAGRTEDALRGYERMRSLYPHDATAYVFAGYVLAGAGRLDEAEAMHRAGTACTAGAADEAWYNLGLVLRAQERYDDAAVAFVHALELDPRYVDAQAALDDVAAALRSIAMAPALPR